METTCYVKLCLSDVGCKVMISDEVGEKILPLALFEGRAAPWIEHAIVIDEKKKYPHVLSWKSKRSSDRLSRDEACALLKTHAPFLSKKKEYETYLMSGARLMARDIWWKEDIESVYDSYLRAILRTLIGDVVSAKPLPTIITTSIDETARAIARLGVKMNHRLTLCGKVEDVIAGEKLFCQKSELMDTRLRYDEWKVVVIFREEFAKWVDAEIEIGRAHV